MNRTLIALFVAVLVPAALGADPMRGNHEKGYSDEVEALIDEHRDREIGSLTVGELEEMMDRLSISMRKRAYVSHSRMASYLFPGLGQFRNDAPGAGVLFFLGNLALHAGTMIGSYLLLPGDLQFDAIDYLRAPYSEIESAWYAKSFLDLAPSMGVAAGGMMLQGAFRMVSAAHAGKLAKGRIEADTVRQ